MGKQQQQQKKQKTGWFFSTDAQSLRVECRPHCKGLPVFVPAESDKPALNNAPTLIMQEQLL